MKTVIKNDELKLKIKEAVELLCDSVKVTLGAKGCNAIIDSTFYPPFITNDGVTIAKNIESDDEVVNAILTITKEASIKTDELVGDGTTSTLVLLKEIYNKCSSLIEKNENPLIIKKQLDKSLNEVLELLKKEVIIPSNNNLLKVAITSSSSEEIGQNIFDMYSKVKEIKSINIKEGKGDTKLLYTKGYMFDTNLASSYYFRDSREIRIDNPFVLTLRDNLNDIEEIEDIVNFVSNNNESILIFAPDYSYDVINPVISMYLDDDIGIYLFKNPEYGYRQIEFINDIDAISNVSDNMSKRRNFGRLNGAFINKDNTILEFNNNNLVNNRINFICNNLNEIDDYDKEFLLKRKSMLENGIGTILVGGITDIEIREKKMRYDDALCAIKEAEKGVLLGGGIPLLKIDSMLDENNILKNTLSSIFKQICINSYVDYNDIFYNIKNNNYKQIFNVETLMYEDINNTNVIDSYNVMVNVLKNACSIASMLFTTNILVVNEQKLDNKESIEL